MATREGIQDLFDRLDRLGYSLKMLGPDLGAAAEEWADFLDDIPDAELIPACDRYLKSNKAQAYRDTIIMPKPADIAAWARERRGQDKWVESFGVRREFQRWYLRARYGREIPPGYPDPRIYQCCEEGHNGAEAAVICGEVLPNIIDYQGRELLKSNAAMRLVDDSKEARPPMSPAHAHQDDMF